MIVQIFDTHGNYICSLVAELPEKRAEILTHNLNVFFTSCNLYFEARMKKEYLET